MEKLLYGVFRTFWKCDTGIISHDEKIHDGFIMEKREAQLIARKARTHIDSPFVSISIRKVIWNLHP